MYKVKINKKEYNIFADFQLKNELEGCKVKTCYPKALSLEKKKEINYSFGDLVIIIDFGSRSFWQKYWSKTENRLFIK